jgi:hypothetical protein
LAKELEGKVETDTISKKIVKQLKDIVSPSFIRECLDEKYKQKVRVDNAKKKKQRLPKEFKLATLPVLNQEVKKKEVIVLDVDGRMSIQKDEGEPPSTTTTDLDTMTTDRNFDQPYHRLKSQQDQDLKSKKHIDYNHEPTECHGCQVLYDENIELKETLEKSSQLIIADKIASVSTVSTHDNHAYTSNDILPFEFSVPYKDTQRYMQGLFQKTGGDRRVWFNGKINTKTGVVTSSNVGRINQPQHQQ